MPAQSGILTLTSSAVSVVAGSFGSGSVHGYIHVRLKMITGTAYLGDSGATTAGYPLTTSDTAIQETLLTGETLYAYSSSATLAVLRLGETT